MEALRVEAFKAALSISAPSLGLIEWCLTSLSSFAPARWLRALGETIQTSPSLPGELGRQFSEAGGFPIILIAIGVGLVFGENLVWAEALTVASQTWPRLRRWSRTAACSPSRGKVCCWRGRTRLCVSSCGIPARD